MEKKKVDTRAVAKKLILIAIAQSVMGCRFEPKHYERLTQADRQELNRLLNND